MYLGDKNICKLFLATVMICLPARYASFFEVRFMPLVKSHRTEINIDSLVY